MIISNTRENDTQQENEQKKKKKSDTDFSYKSKRCGIHELHGVSNIWK